MSKYNTSQSPILIYKALIDEIKHNLDQQYILQLNNFNPYSLDQYITTSGITINNKTELKGLIISLLLNNIML